APARPGARRARPPTRPRSIARSRSWCRRRRARPARGTPRAAARAATASRRAGLVPEAVDRLDRVGGVAEVHPQPTHVHVDGARVELAAQPPHLAEQLL